MPTAAPRAKSALSTGTHAPHRLSVQACSPRSLTCSTTLIMCADVVRVGEVEFPVDDMTNVTPNILAKVCIAGSHSCSTRKRCTCFCERNSTLWIVQQHHSTLFSVATLQSLVFFNAVLARLSLHTQTSCGRCVCLCTNWTKQLGMMAWLVTHIFHSCITC
jgi:hypothetical protein